MSDYFSRKDDYSSDYYSRAREPVTPENILKSKTMETAFYNTPPQQNTRDQLEEVVDMLYRRKWTIILVFLLVTSAVAAYTFTIEPEYQARSYVMLDLGGRSSLQMQEQLPSESTSLFAGFNRSLAGELQLLELSNQLKQRVEQRLEAREMMAGSDQPGFGGEEEESSLLDGDIEFRPAGEEGINIIEMRAYSTVPRDAALLANIYAEEYVQLTRESSRTHITASRMLLEEQERKRRDELRSAEEAVQDYISREGAVGLDQGAKYLIQQIATLEAQRDNAKIELQTRQASLVTLEEELAELNPQLARRIASVVEQQIQAAQTQLAQKEVEKDLYLRKKPAPYGRLLHDHSAGTTVAQ